MDTVVVTRKWGCIQVERKVSMMSRWIWIASSESEEWEEGEKRGSFPFPSRGML